jgi:hypothetical protein
VFIFYFFSLEVFIFLFCSAGALSDRKLRCDGERPCGNCASRQLSDTCDYDTEVRRRGPAKGEKKGKRRKTITTATTSAGNTNEDESGVKGRKGKSKEEEEEEEEEEDGEARASGASRTPSNDPIASQIRDDLENREILPLTGSSVGVSRVWRLGTERELDRGDGS